MTSTTLLNYTQRKGSKRLIKKDELFNLQEKASIATAKFQQDAR